MKRDKAITILLRRAGQREGDTTLESQVIDEMQLQQEHMERSGVQLPPNAGGGIFWPDFLKSEVKTAQTTAGEPRVQIPDDFCAEAEDGSLFLFDYGGSKKWRPLNKDHYDILRSQYTGQSGEQGKPEYYAVVGDYFYLFPIPDAVYDLRLVYYEAKEVLDSDIENAWLKYAPELLISSTGEVMAGQILYDGELEQRFRNRRQMAALQLHNASVGREMANLEMARGEHV